MNMVRLKVLISLMSALAGHSLQGASTVLAPTPAAAATTSEVIKSARAQEQTYTPHDIVAYLKTREVPHELKKRLDTVFSTSAMHKLFTCEHNQKDERHFTKALAQQGFRHMRKKTSAYIHRDFPEYVFKFSKPEEKAQQTPWSLNCERILYGDIIKKIAHTHHVGDYRVIIPEKFLYPISGLAEEDFFKWVVVAQYIDHPSLINCAYSPNPDSLWQRLEAFCAHIHYNNHWLGNILIRGEPYNDIVILDTEPSTLFIEQHPHELAWYRTHIAQLLAHSQHTAPTTTPHATRQAHH